MALTRQYKVVSAGRSTCAWKVVRAVPCGTLPTSVSGENDGLVEISNRYVRTPDVPVTAAFVTVKIGRALVGALATGLTGVGELMTTAGPITNWYVGPQTPVVPAPVARECQ